MGEETETITEKQQQQKLNCQIEYNRNHDDADHVALLLPGTSVQNDVASNRESIQ